MLGKNNENLVEVLDVINSSLDLTGKGSKQIILDYLNTRYGMNPDLIVQYRQEFENYLRETIGDSADVIISKINEKLHKDVSCNKQTKRVSDVAHFLICDNCFWCASVLKVDYELKCQSCSNKITSMTPVMSNEKFAVEVDKKRGVTLSFQLSR
jgi:hypothetical protein